LSVLKRLAKNSFSQSKSHNDNTLHEWWIRFAIAHKETRSAIHCQQHEENDKEEAAKKKPGNEGDRAGPGTAAIRFRGENEQPSESSATYQTTSVRRRTLFLVTLCRILNILTGFFKMLPRLIDGLVQLFSGVLRRAFLMTGSNRSQHEDCAHCDDKTLAKFVHRFLLSVLLHY
jgi:hypothetical protein